MSRRDQRLTANIRRRIECELAGVRPKCELTDLSIAMRNGMSQEEVGRLVKRELAGAER